MNSLSWIIYAADVLGELKTGMAILSAIGCIVVVAAFIVGNAKWSYYSWHDQEARERSEAFRLKIQSFGKVWVLFAMVCLLGISALIPQSKTLYMIAASEAGETVVTSPEAKEMLGDLKEIIRRKLAQELKGEVAL